MVIFVRSGWSVDCVGTSRELGVTDNVNDGVSTTRVTVAVCANFELDPITLMLYVPFGVFVEVWTWSVEVNGVCPEAGFRVHVTPCGGDEDTTKLTGTGLLHANDDPTARL